MQDQTKQFNILDRSKTRKPLKIKGFFALFVYLYSLLNVNGALSPIAICGGDPHTPS